MQNQTPPEVYVIILGWILAMAAGALYLLGWIGVWFQQRYFMSRAERPEPALEAVAERATGNEALNSGQGFAKPGNEDDEDTGNAPATGTHEGIDPVKLDILIKLINAGMVSQTAAIETIFECKRSGRADSLYQRVRAALPQSGPQYPPRTPEQVEFRKRMGLDREAASRPNELTSHS